MSKNATARAGDDGNLNLGDDCKFICKSCRFLYTQEKKVASFRSVFLNSIDINQVLL